MRHLPKILLIVVAAVLAATGTVQAQEPAVPSAIKRPVQGYYFTVEGGDSVMMIVLSEVPCFPELKFKDRKEEEFYWKTVRDVKKTLPYAKMISETLVETYEYIETFPTQKEREAHLKKMESDVFNQYKPVLKKFTKGQATMLIKLVRRETNQSSYDLLKAFLGSFRAGFWQTFGRLFGVNLKKDYNPDKNREDAIIERVASLVELGML